METLNIRTWLMDPSRSGGAVLFSILLGLSLPVLAVETGGGTSERAASVDDSEAFSKAPDKTALWLARSCIGEAGWRAFETGECAAIWHIYRKRARAAGLSVLVVARGYSSAIKDVGQPWVRTLAADGSRPKHWPSNLAWSRYRDRWVSTLELAGAFTKGQVDDPLPAAGHYGCFLDRGRLHNKLWKRIEGPAGFRNDFYERR